MNNERRDELERLLNDRDARVNRFFELAVETPLDLEDAIDEARFDAASRLAPELRNLRNSTYLVRIRSDDGQDDQILGSSLRTIMANVEDEVAAAAPNASAEARLTIDDITRGSVVLHYRAVKPLASVKDGQFDHGLSIVDDAIARVSELHRALDAGRSYAEIASLAHSPDLLEASRDLLFAMDKNGLTLTTRWRNAKGVPVVSALSQSARKTALDVFQKEAVPPESIPISGIVNGINLDGKIQLKSAPGKKKHSWEVIATPDLVTSGEFRLGETIHIVVRQEVTSDHVGLTSTPKYYLERIEPDLNRDGRVEQ